MEHFIIDCQRCVMRGPACQQCVVSVLVEPTETWELSADEHQAVISLASVGLLPGIQMRRAGQANGTEG